MILIGSQAMRWYYPDWASERKDAIQDYDFICTTDEFKSLVKTAIATGNRLLSVEYPGNKAIAKFENAQKKMVVVDASLVDKEGGLSESDRQIYEFYKGINAQVVELQHFGTFFCIDFNEMHVASPEVCFLLKESHKYKKDSPHFQKTRKDLLTFYSLGYNRDNLEEYEKSWLAYREHLTYKDKLPNLNQGKQAFFTDSVKYVADHDSIHLAVKHLDKPAYEYYKKDGSEVFCDVNKWNVQPEIVKLYGVLEETYVLALERAIIPHGTAPERAFDIALEKVCTSITSGFFREFAWSNYDTVKAMYHSSFVQKFEDALVRGEIKDYKKEVASY